MGLCEVQDVQKVDGVVTVKPDSECLEPGTHWLVSECSTHPARRVLCQTHANMPGGDEDCLCRQCGKRVGVHIEKMV